MGFTKDRNNMNSPHRLRTILAGKGMSSCLCRSTLSNHQTTMVEDMSVAFLLSRNRASSQGRTEFKCKSVPHSHRHLCILTSSYQSVSPKGSHIPLLNSQRLCKNHLNRSFLQMCLIHYLRYSVLLEKNQQYKQQEEVKLSTDVNSS